MGDESIIQQIAFRGAGFLNRVKSAVVVGNDQSSIRYKRTGATVDAANAIDDAFGLGIEDLIGGKFDASVFEPNVGQFADREHPLVAESRCQEPHGAQEAHESRNAHESRVGPVAEETQGDSEQRVAIGHGDPRKMQRTSLERSDPEPIVG